MTDPPELSVEEFSRLLDDTIQEIQDDMFLYDERAAIRDEHIPVDPKEYDAYITQRALDALERPERFAGEHEVARQWLKNYDQNAGRFRRCDE